MAIFIISTEDPLLSWLWSIYEALQNQNSSQLNNFADLDVLVTSCIDTFKSDPRYRDDIRFLKIWFLYMDASSDYERIYKEMEEHRICIGEAMLYEAYALFLEAKGRLIDASIIYHRGISRNVKPLERLKKSQVLFLERMSEKVMNGTFQKNGGIYKNLLQEYAQKNASVCPSYETVTSGMPHRPTFVSTVTVVGTLTYQGAKAKNKKLAEMNAAKVAYCTLTKENSTELEGPPHAQHFKSRVSIGGKSYTTLELFQNVKKANQAAAKVACQTLSVEDGGIYKNLLQEYAQKNASLCPSYETVTSGMPHLPTFVSTVTVVGTFTYQGAEAKNKKLAEMNAAKVAYCTLTKGNKFNL